MAKKQQSPVKRFVTYTRTTPFLAVLAALVVVGSSSALVATNQVNTTRNAEIEVPANLEGLLSFDEVRALAAKDSPNLAIKGIELEKEDNGMVYEVKFADGSVRVYDAKTGAPIVQSDDTEEPDENVPADFTAGITAAQARSIALAKRAGTITKIELETEEGVVVYSVRYNDGGRVDVNATDGSILRVRGASDSDRKDSETSSDDSTDSSNSESTDDSSDSGSNETVDTPDDSDRRSGNSGSGQSGGGSEDSSND